MFPAAFIQQMQTLLGSDCDTFLSALQEDSRTSIRLNKAKPARLNYNLSRPALWCDGGFYLEKRPLFTLDPFIHGGAYYVQEASSMFLAHVVKQLRKKSDLKTALDLCAAPGGKSTLLADNLPENTLLVANEVIHSRANILCENISKWGSPGVVVTNNDPKDFASLPNFFDLIAVDAPCSGEGMFRKDEKTCDEWSEANVQLCAERQRRILADVWDSLKVGGYLVYSTCTFNSKENEENVWWMQQELGAQSIKIAIPLKWGIATSEEINLSENLRGAYGYRFFPHKVKGEGLFISVLQKTAGDSFPSRSESKNKHTIKYADNQDVEVWLRDADRLIFSQKGDEIFAVKAEHAAFISKVENSLRVMQCGVQAATLKGKDAIPTASLALSTQLNREAFTQQDVDLKDALLFLKKEAFASQSQSRGFELICYENTSLGFVKNLGNRCNNLYPQEWRIRMRINER